jgi:hypothetical protein
LREKFSQTKETEQAARQHGDELETVYINIEIHNIAEKK